MITAQEARPGLPRDAPSENATTWSAEPVGIGTLGRSSGVLIYAGIVSAASSMNTTRSDIKSPGKYDGDDEAERNENGDQLDRPVRQAQIGRYRRGDLNNDPAANGIQHYDSDYAASFQLGPKASYGALLRLITHSLF